MKCCKLCMGKWLKWCVYICTVYVLCVCLCVCVRVCVCVCGARNYMCVYYTEHVYMCVHVAACMYLCVWWSLDMCGIIIRMYFKKRVYALS